MTELLGVLKDRRLMVEISLWGFFWSVALSFSVGIFGSVPALVTIAGLMAFMSYIWYRTGKRDVRQMEAAREKSIRSRNDQNSRRG